MTNPSKMKGTTMSERERRAPKARRPPVPKPKRKGKNPEWVSDLGATARTAGRALALAQMTWAAVNPEMKFVDTISTATMSTTMTYVPLNLIAQGLTDNTRVGNSIRIKRVDIGWKLTTPSAATVGCTNVVQLLRKIQAGGAAVVTADAYTNSGTLPVMNPDGFTNYKVEYEKTTALSTTAGGNPVSFDQVSLDIDKHCQYNTTTGVITAINTNLLSLAFATDATSNQATLSYYCRLWYLDN